MSSALRSLLYICHPIATASILMKLFFRLLLPLLIAGFLIYRLYQSLSLPETDKTQLIPQVILLLAAIGISVYRLVEFKNSRFK